MCMCLSAGCRVCLPAWTWWRDAACSTKTSCPSPASSTQSERCFPNISQPKHYLSYYRWVPKRIGIQQGLSRIFFVFLLHGVCFVAGASRWDPGGHQQRSCGSQPAGVGQEETHSSEAAHAQDRWSVSKRLKTWHEACQCAGTASVKKFSNFLVWYLSGWTMERSVAAPERRERRSDCSTSTRRSSRALWGRSGRTRASWPERSSTRSWTGGDNILYQTKIRREKRFVGESTNVVLVMCFRDAERKRKVRELFGSLATQEGEWKALKRRKRKWDAQSPSSSNGHVR